MSIDTHDLRPIRVQTDDPRSPGLYEHARRRTGETWARENFSTALFTSLNIGVFLVLAASVVGAAILYSQGA